jgi:DNA-binding protein HU-beta
VQQLQQTLYVNMNKNELVEFIATAADISKAKAALALDAFTVAVTNSLKKGEDVSLVGFGTFSVAERSARNGRNPLTGESIQIAASRAPKFRAGKTLKDAVK